MSKLLTVCMIFLGIAMPHVADARVDLSTLDENMAGPRATVLVLGTVHLSELPDDFDPDSLEPVLARLARFNPGVITIEAIPGESCDLMSRHPAAYDPESVSHYCRSPELAEAATGLDVAEAIAQVDTVLAQWPANPTPGQRRHLSAVFLAAGDRASALTQWWQLEASERRAGDGLDDALVSVLDSAATRNNENYQVAARLAARLGLQRVFPIDDHTGDSLALSETEIPAFGRAIQQAWDSSATQTGPLREREREFVERGDMLALYRYINRPDIRAIQADGDFGAAMRETSAQHYGQRYVAGWETRNLRMVANIRAAFRGQPGARVLSIVGASHKPWFDSLLGQMQGVDVVDVEKVLGQSGS